MQHTYKQVENTKKDLNANSDADANQLDADPDP